MAVRVFDLTGSASYTTITLGVDYAVQHNADVINMSLGFEILPGFESDDTDLMDEAFARALKAGTTVCVASGNEYTDTARSYPASSRWTIAVGSLEPDKDGNSYIRSDFPTTEPCLILQHREETSSVHGSARARQPRSQAEPQWQRRIWQRQQPMSN